LGHFHNLHREFFRYPLKKQYKGFGRQVFPDRTFLLPFWISLISYSSPDPVQLSACFLRQTAEFAR
jgi:hypothetical protein